jgi:superfamily II DNA/RNA helicase
MGGYDIVGRAGNKGTAITLVGREPIISNVAHRITEIDEMEYLKKIEDFMKKKLTPTKVPGPWSDDGFNTNFQLEMKKMKLLKLEKREIEKQKKKEEEKEKKEIPINEYRLKLLSRNPKLQQTKVIFQIFQHQPIYVISKTTLPLLISLVHSNIYTS